MPLAQLISELRTFNDFGSATQITEADAPEAAEVPIFVEGVAGPLFGGPEFVHKNRDFSSLRSVRFRDLRGAAKIVEGT